MFILVGGTFITLAAFCISLFELFADHRVVSIMISCCFEFVFPPFAAYTTNWTESVEFFFYRHMSDLLLT